MTWRVRAGDAMTSPGVEWPALLADLERRLSALVLHRLSALVLQVLAALAPCSSGSSTVPLFDPRDG